MPDLDIDLPLLLERRAGQVRPPALSGLRQRSRRCRQRRAVAVTLTLTLVTVPVVLQLPGSKGPGTAQVATEPRATLDLYLQSGVDRRQAAPRTTGAPVLHVHVVSATVTKDRGTGAVQLVLSLKPSDQAAFTAFGPGDQVALVVNRGCSARRCSKPTSRGTCRSTGPSRRCGRRRTWLTS
jgi:hypothetical protein